VELCKKKEENCLNDGFKSREVGDAYTYLAHKRDTNLLIGFVVGKWNDLTCDEFYKMLSVRLRFPTRKRRVTIYSDGNKQNISGIENNFPQGCVNYGARKKIRDGQNVIGVVSKIIFGNMSKEDVHITGMDGFCSKLRERISCFSRKARSFAKRKLCIEQRLEIFSVQHNFIEHEKGVTPAMKEGLIAKALTWEKIFHVKLTTSK
jgi:hypothetical protein